MTQPDLHTYHTQLLQLQSTLRAQLQQLRGGASGRVQASAAHFAEHEDSHAQSTSARDLELALDEHDSAGLRSIAAALQRIASGHYGYCLDCGTAIAPARLHAAPDAERCIDCQTAHETSI